MCSDLAYLTAEGRIMMSLNRYSGDDVKLKEYIDTIDYSIVKGGKCLELCQRIVDIVLGLLAMIVGIPVILIAGILMHCFSRLTSYLAELGVAVFWRSKKSFVRMCQHLQLAAQSNM